MKSKKGISLIVLIVTIIVIIILAAAVILTLNNNNPIDSSRIAQLADNRASINSAVSLYYGKKMAETQGQYDANEIFTLSYDESDDKKPLVSDVTVKIGENPTLNLIDTANTKDLLNLTLPTVSDAAWYLDVNSGLVYLVYENGKIPSWAKNNGALDSTLATFVLEKPAA